MGRTVRVRELVHSFFLCARIRITAVLLRRWQVDGWLAIRVCNVSPSVQPPYPRIAIRLCFPGKKDICSDAFPCTYFNMHFTLVVCSRVAHLYICFVFGRLVRLSRLLHKTKFLGIRTRRLSIIYLIVNNI